jgi:hypothetical protein
MVQETIDYFTGLGYTCRPLTTGRVNGYDYYSKTEVVLESSDKTYPNGSQSTHSIILGKDNVWFNYLTSTEHEDQSETWDYFESPEDVWSWVQGWLDDVLDQEYTEG